MSNRQDARDVDKATIDFGVATLPIDDIDTYERGDPLCRRIVKPNVLLHIATTLNDGIVRHDDGLDVGYPNRIAYLTTKWPSSFLRKNSLSNSALTAFASTQSCRVRSTARAFRKSLQVALIKLDRAIVEATLAEFSEQSIKASCASFLRRRSGKVSRARKQAVDFGSTAAYRM